MLTINYKNLAENLMIVVVSVLLGGTIGFFAAVKSHKLTVEQLRPTIERAIDKETIKNEIKNEIDIHKIKKSDSLKIIFDPTNNQKPINVISRNDSCIPVRLISNREIRKLKRSGVL